MNIDTIKSYLVELGVQVDDKSFSQVEKAFQRLDKAVNNTVRRISKVFTSLAKTVGLFTALSASIYKFNSSIAQSDMEMQKWAKRMFMTEDSAKSLQRTLDAMGLSGIEDLQDVALSPELTRYYKELRELSMSLSNDQSVKDGLRAMREVSQQFAKIRITLSYLMDKITAAFMKVFNSSQGKSFMKLINDINTKLVRNIDRIAESIAKTMNIIISVFLAAGRVASHIYDAFNKLPDIVRNLGVALTVISLAFMKSPLGATLTALFLLIEDFIGFKSGADSSHILKPIWEAMDTIGDLLMELIEALKSFHKEVVKPIGERVVEGAKGIWDWATGKDLEPDTPEANEEMFRALDRISEEYGLPKDPWRNPQSTINNINRPVSQDITINVNGAQNPKVVAEEVSLALYRQYQNGVFA